MPDRFTDACNRARRAYHAAVDAESLAVFSALLGEMTPAKQRRLDELAARVRAAREEMARVCQGQLVTIDLPGGCTLRQEPGVKDEARERVRDLIRTKIPDGDLDGLTDITLSDDPPPRREVEVREEGGGTGRRSVDADGSYDRSAKRIVDWDPPREETIKHEIGHHVYFDRFTDEQRQRWTTFWRQHRDRMPTDYAKTHEKEGFAEVYEWLRDRKALDDAVLEMMLSLVQPNPEH